MTLNKLIEKSQKTPEFQAASLFLDFSEIICAEMATQDINKAELARRMKKSRAYITRALSGNYGYPTIRTMSKFSKALGLTITITKETTTDAED